VLGNLDREGNEERRRTPPRTPQRGWPARRSLAMTAREVAALPRAELSEPEAGGSDEGEPSGWDDIESGEVS
jgi:hypothetical protein